MGLAAITHALVDLDRLDAAGKLSYLRLTKTQREQVLARMKDLFPKATGKTQGGHAADVAANLFVSFLTSPWKSFDER